MALALLSLVLLSCYAGAYSQGTLTQPASVSGSLGQTVTFSCSKGSGIWQNTVYWYQQRSGESPHFVHCNGCNSRGSGIPDRFTASGSGNVGSLTITNVQGDDEANYFCLCWYGTGRSYVFGAGTTLTVLSQSIVPPSVSVFPPSKEELKSKNKATLACLMDGFYPRVIQVEWKANDRTISAGVETSTPIKQGDKYVASSYLTLSQSEWEANENYICKVIHESKTIEKVVSRSACS